ncbi:hypothetical protein N5079_17285 [Planotetraspora sp. A-T 1434]|uniref:hypothetical protein n=1 Tax=Planotetraspora sp. A-T 1434 TaxID=2979219 RepID=UPI0021C18B8E|nr:hypothetical protein [Planotetraspora sp. A-T 1434]MCT9931958.1 hypothetical protein [Planotetraspora sp. A-T 1434]
MGEFVGVDPANLRELTHRLQALQETLSKHGPAMQQKMQKWGSNVSFAVLPRLIDEALNDARDMDARTSRAYDLAAEQGWNPFGVKPTGGSPYRDVPPPAPIVRLDWATTGQSGYQAQRDAAELSGLLAHTDPATLMAMYGRDKGVIRGLLAPLAERLRGHLNDKDYLGVFWQSVGPLAARLAKTLHDNGSSTDPLLTKEDTAILAAFGAALAAATRLRTSSGSGDSKALLPDSAKAALRAGDPWSIGMLLKYGPHGTAWDTDFLTDITRFMLDARKAGKIDWPSSHQQLTTDMDANHHQRALAEFDAMGAVLDRAAENGKAARHVLGNPTTGLAYTRMLVNDSWHTPGYDPAAYFSKYVDATSRSADPDYLPDPGKINLSSHTAAFLQAAVSAGRGTTLDAKESAWSVVNIVQSTSEFSKVHPGTVLPHEIRKALIFTADRYLPDFAASVNHDFTSAAMQKANDTSNPWTPVTKASELEAFFNQALQDPEEFGAFKGMMDGRISIAVAATIKDPSDENYLVEMGSLYGLIERLKGQRHFATEQLADEDAARRQTALSIVTGGFGALSFNKALGIGTISQIIVALATPPASGMFDTGHALQALRENADAFRTQVLHVEVPVIQGLITAGAVRPPANASWISNGVVTPDAALADWISQHAETEYSGKTLTEWIRDAQDAMRLQQ